MSSSEGSLYPFRHEDLVNAVKAIWNSGGRPDTAIVCPKVYNSINSYYHAGLDKEYKLTRIVTDYGDIDIMLNEHVPEDTMYIYDRRFSGVRDIVKIVNLKTSNKRMTYDDIEL